MKKFSLFAIIMALLFTGCEQNNPDNLDTNNKDNYLVLDNDMALCYEDIVGVIPETIPENATNVVYKYHYEPWADGWIYFYWMEYRR